MKELEESTSKAYENMYWTRLIAMDDFQANRQEIFQIGPDIAELVVEMYRMDDESIPEW